MSRSTVSTPQWLHAREVLARLGVSFQTVCNWRDDGCPYLGGRKLKAKPVPGKQPRYRYHRGDVAAIEAVFAADAARTPHDSPWLPIGAASVLSGVHRS